MTLEELYNWAKKTNSQDMKVESMTLTNGEYKLSISDAEKDEKKEKAS